MQELGWGNVALQKIWSLLLRSSWSSKGDKPINKVCRWLCFKIMPCYLSHKISIAQTFIIHAQTGWQGFSSLRLGSAEIGPKHIRCPCVFHYVSYPPYSNGCPRHILKTKNSRTSNKPKPATQIRPLHVSCPLIFHCPKLILRPNPKSGGQQDALPGRPWHELELMI